jgi:endonuclease/exonuclease/phosphatase family metal-dependent hydrolase
MRISSEAIRTSACLLLSAILAGTCQAEMRIASLNLEKKYGPKLIAEIGNEPNLRAADILLLQEVVDAPQAHVADEVAAALGMHAVFAPAFRLNGQFEEGLAILSRYPLGEKTVTGLPHNQLHFHTRVRIVLTAATESPLGPVGIVNTHLDNRINASAKRRQLDLVWETAGKYPGACIIGGDFNTANFFWISHLLPVPGAQSLNRLLRAGMARHGFTTPLGKGRGTLHFLGLKLDWIYLRGLTAKSSGVTPIGFSDHNSVWVLAGP